MEIKVGVVAYDQERKSSTIYQNIINNEFGKEGINCIKAWDNVDALISYAMNDNAIILNTLKRILVLDTGFNNSNDTTRMANEFISLQEVFENKGITNPLLTLATSNNELYDLFKTHTEFKGHATFVYDKTRINVLKKDSNGSISAIDLENILMGRSDETALSIRHDYKDRGTVLSEQFDRIQQQAKKQDTNNALENLRQQLRNEVPEDKLKEEQEKNEHKSQTQKLKEQQRNDVLAAHERFNGNNLDQLSEQLKDNSLSNTLVSSKVSDDSSSNTQNRQVYTKDDIVNFNDLNKTYKNTKRELIDYSPKLAIEKNVILFTGKTGSGVTSLMYNIANIYRMYNRKVLMINLDEYDDLIKYDNNFIKYYQQKNIHQAFLTNFVNLDDITINLHNNFSIISDYGKLQHEQNYHEKTRNTERILKNAIRLYDLILIDCGNNFNEVYEKISNQVNNIIVVTNVESLDSLDNFSHEQSRLQQNILNFIYQNKKMPGIVINKLDFKINTNLIENQIKQLKTALNNSRYVGSVLYDKHWNLQINSQVPYCLQSKNKFNKIKYLAERIVV